MEVVENIHLLHSPSNFVITGMTGSGKTTLLLNLLKAWPFEQKMGKIVYFYQIFQPLFKEFLREFPAIKFIQGLQTDEIENPANLSNVPGVVDNFIIDDLSEEAVKNPTFVKLLTVISHHKNVNTFFLNQNCYYRGPHATTISRNCHYFIMTKTPHLSILDTLNSQLYGGKGPLKEAYKKAIADKKRGYLLIDMFTDDVKNRLRSNILPSEEPTIIWRPCSS